MCERFFVKKKNPLNLSYSCKTDAELFCGVNGFYCHAVLYLYCALFVLFVPRDFLVFPLWLHYTAIKSWLWRFVGAAKRPRQTLWMVHSEMCQQCICPLGLCNDRLGPNTIVSDKSIPTNQKILLLIMTLFPSSSGVIVMQCGDRNLCIHNRATVSFL